MFTRVLQRGLIASVGVSSLIAATQYQQYTLSQEDDFRTLTCVANEQHTHNTRKISFALPETQKSWTLRGAIANILVRVGGPGAVGTCCGCCGCGASCTCPIGAHGCCGCCACGPAPKKCGCPKKEVASSSSVKRNYNPLDTEPGLVSILVKKYENGKMGTALHSLQPGEQVEYQGPRQQWTFEHGKYRHYGMVAGGTGLTPLIQAARCILRANDGSRVSLVTFNHSPEDILLEWELRAMEEKYGSRLQVTHFVAGGMTFYDRLPSSTLREGKVNTTILRELMPAPGPGVLVMACGRKGMTNAIAGPKAKDWTQGNLGGMLAEIGYTKDQVWKV